MIKKNRVGARVSSGSELEVMKARLDDYRHQINVASEALSIINQLDWSCNHGSGKSGFAIAGYVARIALEKINH